MGWKIAISGALAAVLGMFLAASGVVARDGSLTGVGFAVLAVGAVLTVVGLMAHSDRRFREIARELADIRDDLARMAAAGDGAKAEGGPDGGEGDRK